MTTAEDLAQKDEAQAWANSYKGSTVMVHLDPRDPTRSVLREEDLYSPDRARIRTLDGQ